MRKGLATLTTTASNSGEVPHMAAVAKSANAASPSLKRSKEGVERVEEGAGVLLMEGIGTGCDDDGARGSDGTSVLCPGSERARERGRDASEGECGIGVLLSPSWT
jgi:hypothetical protein